ncbi:MAG: fatty acid desaturase family protein [Nevskiales bacterium]
MTNNIKEMFSREEMRELTAKSDWRGAWTIIKVWGAIAVTFAVLAAFPNPLTFILAVFILGGQQLTCAIITHEAAHRTLFKTRWLNDHFSDFIGARPIWTDVFRYREHHIKHHAHTGTGQDPDMSLVTPFPTTSQSLRKKVIRDLTGRTGVRRLIGLIAMDLGILKYTVAAEVERIPRGDRSIWDYACEGFKNITPVILSNAVMVAVLAAFDIAWVYSAWVIAYLTTFSLYIRIRSIAEHACLPGGEDIFENTRTTKAGLLAKLTVAPMNVNYHQEHHLMASVPYYRLPKMHRLLRERGHALPAPGYAQVMRQATAA